MRRFKSWDRKQVLRALEHVAPLGVKGKLRWYSASRALYAFSEQCLDRQDSRDMIILGNTIADYIGV